MDNNEYINEIIRINLLKKEEILDYYIVENNNNQFLINNTDNSLNYVYNISSIKITQDNFYIGFSLEDPETYDNFIDETIYYPKTYFKTGKRYGHRWK